MHRALLVEDILLAIFESMDSLGTALALSLCAQRFLGIGMGAIWKNTGARELALTMPERFCDEDQAVNGLNEIVSCVKNSFFSH